MAEAMGRLKPLSRLCQVGLTEGSRNLNRILRLTANLLFEKGEDPQNVYRLLEGFVARRQVHTWYEKYCSINGVPTTQNLKSHKRRVPMPPIDWEGVKLDELEEKLDKPQETERPPDLW